MSSYNCSSCGSGEIFLRKKNMQTGVYCKNCGQWHKWIGKKDISSLTNRGFKVMPESYTPFSEGSPNDQVPTNHVPYMSSANQDLGVEHGYAPPNENYASSPEPTYQPQYQGTHQPPQYQAKQVKKEPCKTCITGVIEPLNSSEDIRLNIYEGVVFARDKKNTKLYGSFAITHCPMCGEKLQ